jgi:hypothetical protein
MGNGEGVFPAEFFPIGDLVFRKHDEQDHLRIEQVENPDGMHQNGLSGQQQELLQNIRIHAGSGSTRNQYSSIF